MTASPTPREMAERLMELHARTTQGTWRLDRHRGLSRYYGNLTSDLPEQVFGSNAIRTIGLVLKYAPPDEQKANGDLWVAAHNDLPAICAALLAAQERVRELEAVIRDTINDKRSTFRARNGREVGIQDDSGEKCWIVGHESIWAMERALKESDHG